MSGVRVESYALCGDACCRSWQSVDLASLAAPVDPGVTTVIYVHGNRISSGQDKHRGLFVYRRLARCADGDAPIRFVILSWPAAQIPGPLKDARVKAARTGPVACQLAWLLSQMPADQPIGLIGYSYGARVVTGALHVIAGGHLSGMGAACDCGERAPVNVVLYGAALDADWLAPGHYHGLAMTQVDCMLLLNNRRDRVMRWYPLAAANGKPQALGLAGPTCIGPYGCQISNCDLSRAIGAQHDEHAYLSAPGAASRIWRYATRSVQ